MRDACADKSDCRCNIRSCSPVSWTSLLETSFAASRAAIATARAFANWVTASCCRSVKARWVAAALSTAAVAALASARAASAAALASRQRTKISRASACNMSFDKVRYRSACLACRRNCPARASISARIVASRARLLSAARSFCSASLRRTCSPEMPAASSSICRRSCGFAEMIAPIRP